MGRNALVKMIANLRKTKPKGRPAPTSDTHTRASIGSYSGVRYGQHNNHTTRER
jgi:hypothetical protein